MAQPPGRPWRVGFLAVRGRPTAFESDVYGAFVRGLRDRGYVEGRNVLIEWRFANNQYERLPELAAELVSLKVDVIVTHSRGIAAAKQATGTIPIVMATSEDALGTGYVSNLAHPGGNVTGSTFFGPELHLKRLEILKEALPRTRRIGVLMLESTPPGDPVVSSIETAAKRIYIDLVQFRVRSLSQLDGTFADMRRRKIDAFLIVDSPMLIVQSQTVVDKALEHRLAAFGSRESAANGGLIGYGVDFDIVFRSAAGFVDRIFKGARPGDLPVEQPTTFDFVLNAKTAKALGIKLPDSVRIQATTVVE